jgi:hypothetical protein
LVLERLDVEAERRAARSTRGNWPVSGTAVDARTASGRRNRPDGGDIIAVELLQNGGLACIVEAPATGVGCRRLGHHPQSCSQDEDAELLFLALDLLENGE